MVWGRLFQWVLYGLDEADEEYFLDRWYHNTTFLITESYASKNWLNMGNPKRSGQWGDVEERLEWHQHPHGILRRPWDHLQDFAKYWLHYHSRILPHQITTNWGRRLTFIPLSRSKMFPTLASLPINQETIFTQESNREDQQRWHLSNSVSRINQFSIEEHPRQFMRRHAIFIHVHPVEGTACGRCQKWSLICTDLTMIPNGLRRDHDCYWPTIAVISLL